MPIAFSNSHGSLLYDSGVSASAGDTNGDKCSMDNLGCLKALK